MKAKIRKYRVKKPYDTKGNANFGFTKNKSGIYMIRENGKIVYVGFSASNLYKTLYRHFQQWNHPGQPVTTYVNKMRYHSYTVGVALTAPGAASKIEQGLIFKHKPRDNKGKMPLEITQAEKDETARYEAQIRHDEPF